MRIDRWLLPLCLLAVLPSKAAVAQECEPCLPERVSQAESRLDSLEAELLELIARVDSLSAPPDTTPPPPPPPPPPPSDEHPNEPSGFVPVADNPYTQDMYTDVNGETWTSFQRDNAASLLDSATTPHSPPSVVQFNWFQGQEASANGQAHMLEIATPNTGEIYTHAVFRISDTWQAHTKSNTHKFVAWNGGVLGGALRPFMTVLSGQTPGQARVYFGFQDSHTRDSGMGPFNMDPNIADPTITPGEWWHLEVYSRLNQTDSSGGCDDSGLVRAWLYRDSEPPMLILDADKTKGDWQDRVPGKILGCDDHPEWRQFRYSGLWGGTGGAAPADFWIQFDHYYGSVK